MVFEISNNVSRLEPRSQHHNLLHCSRQQWSRGRRNVTLLQKILYVDEQCFSVGMGIFLFYICRAPSFIMMPLLAVIVVPPTVSG
jgi:hypothetical protein